jgi:ATP-dependent helicase/nuclease subunit A
MCLTQEPYGQAYFSRYPKFQRSGKGVVLFSNWDQLEAEESRFLDAEKARLLYVAATRAGAELVIVQRDARNDYNPWEFFGQYLQGAQPLPDPGPQRPPAGSIVQVAPASVSDGIAAVRQRWQAVSTPGYGQESAKSISVTSFKRTEPVSGGEHGTEWGSVIHVLLETAMRRPESNLQELAYAELKEVGLEVSLADLAVDTVKAVMRSSIWKRAQAAQKRLVEVPFEILMPPAPGTKPTLVRGVIDLVFLEPDGWVIVDYKTDAVPASGVGELAKHYQGQLEIYADSWQRMVSRPVRERGLYFTAVEQYLQV